MFPFTQDAADQPLPAFLDPVLQLIEDKLPAPAYAAFETFLSNFIAHAGGLNTIISTLFRTDFSEWNAQTIVPPLITILVAYLALLNLYKTTRWFVRSAFFMLKWGTILSALMGGAGYFMSGWGQEVATRGFTSAAMSAILDLVNGQGRDATGGDKNRYNTRSRTRGSKPSMWDSFAQHQDWNQQEAEHEDESEGSKLMKGIAKAAVQVLNNNGWLEAAKSVVEDATTEAKKGMDANKGGKGKKKAGSRSR
ncbi:hypothetical protein BDV98DRAFT_562948 [Pterulicium gracile]|uniref:Uncharacterized protein n=1 Tax=Pterulicium gracile TaxID=1884261 RepID=A0A5C3QSC4_9AGAR|nr:hypothetical protein BDV98DRAFT_562948 [Pterula gracilis]